MQCLHWAICGYRDCFSLPHRAFSATGCVKTKTEQCPIIFIHGGLLVKFGGDAMLCLFSGEDYGAINAVRAAWEMKQAMADPRFAEVVAFQETFKLDMKVGSNSGLLFAASVGNEEHREYILSGSAVERTAQVESAAQRGDVLVSHETHDLVKDHVRAEELRGAWEDSGLSPQSGNSGTFHFTPRDAGTYCFATRATDSAGNVEAAPDGTGDACCEYTSGHRVYLPLILRDD
jgi:hypothetical protein